MNNGIERSSEKSGEERHSLLSGAEVLTAVGGSIIGGGSEETLCFTSVATDSRTVTAGALFVPLYGERQDGHAYIPQALANGATVVFVAHRALFADRDRYERLAANYTAVTFVAVEDTLRALQDAAGAYVTHFPRLIRCAVTGSSGKTTTKEIAASMLRQKYNVICTEGNLNSETGLPLSVFRIRAEHTLGLFEFGMNRTGEIAELATVLKPQYGIITNIGTAHIGLLGSREAIAAEKKHLFTYIDEGGVAIIPADDDFADVLADGVRGTVLRFGGEEDCLRGVRLVRDDGIDGTVFTVDGIAMRLALPGAHNYRNALAAIALARALGVSAAQIGAGIAQVSATGARSRLRRGIYTILEDCYNANPESMEQALALCAAARERKLFVLGDMLELGTESKAAHEAVAERAVAANPALLVLIGEEMRAAYDKALSMGFSRARLVYEPLHDDAAIARVAAAVRTAAARDDLVLLKGSRGMALERLVPLLAGEECA